MVHVLRLYRLLLSAVAAHLWIVTAVTVTRMIQVFAWLCRLHIKVHVAIYWIHFDMRQGKARFPVSFVPNQACNQAMSYKATCSSRLGCSLSTR